jgi:hypothetical protein
LAFQQLNHIGIAIPSCRINQLQETLKIWHEQALAAANNHPECQITFYIADTSGIYHYDHHKPAKGEPIIVDGPHLYNNKLMRLIAKLNEESPRNLRYLAITSRNILDFALKMQGRYPIDSKNPYLHTASGIIGPDTERINTSIGAGINLIFSLIKATGGGRMLLLYIGDDIFPAYRGVEKRFPNGWKDLRGLEVELERQIRANEKGGWFDSLLLAQQTKPYTTGILMLSMNYIGYIDSAQEFGYRTVPSIFYLRGLAIDDRTLKTIATAINADLNLAEKFPTIALPPGLVHLPNLRERTMHGSRIVYGKHVGNDPVVQFPPELTALIIARSGLGKKMTSSKA